MTVTAAPPLSSPSKRLRAWIRVALRRMEALIERARGRARRRRRRYAACALLAALGGGGAYLATNQFGRSEARSSARGARAPAVLRAGAAPFSVRNGPITTVYDRSIYTLDYRDLSRELYSCAGKRCWELASAAWSPDGGKLALGVESIRYDVNALRVFDPVTKIDQILVRDYANDVSWSADGGRLAYVSDGTIKIVDVRPHGPVTVLSTGTGGHDSSPTWSPDGTRIAFSTKLDEVSSVSVIRLDGSDRMTLARHASSPAWSPQGSKIAYRTSCGIRLITPAGRDVTPSTPLSASARRACAGLGKPGVPLWSPDGRWLAIGTRYGIYKMTADGSRLIHWFTVPVWSARGRLARPGWQPVG
ncbi:MAG: hypothetical protein M3R70_01760 [Actinomycetota bacterium]|nr:hypothetical protein [Actinomycetota bacterium]